MRYAEPRPWTDPPLGRCTNRAHQLRRHLEDVFCGENLGCYNDRPVTGGTRPSTHRDGRAIDVGWIHDEPARQDAYEWLVQYHEPLGVQMVLNYVRSGSSRSGVFWRLPRYDDETEPVTGPFHSGGHWLHVEIHPTVAGDPTPIPDLLTPKDTALMRFVKLADDPAQYLAQGTLLLWMPDGATKNAYAAAFSVDPQADIISLHDLQLHTLIGQVPHGDGVSVSAATFAGWIA